MDKKSLGFIFGIIFIMALVTAISYPEPFNSHVDANGYNFTDADWVTANYFDGIFVGTVDTDVNWTKLQNYPSACPGSSAITQLNDSVTCSDLWLDISGNETMTGNFNMGENNITNATEVSSTLIDTTNIEADNLESNLDGTGYNITASWFFGFLNWSNIQNMFSTNADSNLNMGTNNITNVTEVSATLIDTTNLEADNLESNLDGTGYNVTASWFKGYFNWETTDAWSSFNGSLFDFNESQLETVYFLANATQVVTGTGAGTLANIQTYNRTTYNVTEANSDFELRVNFTGITEFTTLLVRHKTSVVAGHTAVVQIWDYGDSAWEGYGVLSEQTTSSMQTFGVYDDSEHIDGGIVQVRFYQDEGVPNTAHIHQFDWVGISKGFGTPVGTEIDPYALYKDGTVPLDANWNQSSYNLTSTTSWFLGKVGWGTIQDKFITAVDDVFIYMSGTTATLNTTKLNESIEAYGYSTEVGTVTSVATDDTYLTGGAITTTGTITFNTTLAGTSLAVNSSDYWDGLGSPSDIGAGDITDDGTYLPLAGGIMAGEINASSNNITDVECIVFESGGSICSGS